MQNTQYVTAVSAVIAYYATQIANAAYDSVAESSNSYNISDNCYKIQFLLSESALHTNAHSLAVACLNANADTAVCECMHNYLMQYA